MPARRGYKKSRRRPYRRRANRGRYMPRKWQITKRPPGRHQANIFNFKRTWSQTLILNNSDAPDGWTSLQSVGDEALVQNFVIGASSIPDFANFANLFDSYRLKGVAIKGYFSNTTSNHTNRQGLLYYVENRAGQVQPTDLTEDYFNQRPRSGRRLLLNSMGKPSFNIYMPLTQLSQTYNTVVNVDYTQQRPRFVSTAELTTPHYGYSLRLNRISDDNWTTGGNNPYPVLKMYYTCYFQLKGINS